MAVLLLAFARPAAAHDFELFGREFSFLATSTLSYQYRADNDNDDARDADDEYHYIFHTIDLSLGSGPFRVGGRFDLHVYIDSYFDSSACAGGQRPASCDDAQRRLVNQYYLYREKAIVPERIYFSVNRPAFDLTLGDFYASFGKGIALNVVKLDDLGQDTTIRGGKLVYHRGAFGFTILGGEINFLDVDQATGWVAPWAAEPLLAARAELDIGGKLQLGAHGVLVLRDHPPRSTGGAGAPGGGADHDAIWGLTVDVPELLGGKLALSGELDFQRTVENGCVVRGFDEDKGGACPDARQFAELHPLRGVASYATATLSLGDWTLSTEGKYYSDFELSAPVDPFEPYRLTYSQPPTLERFDAVPTETANAGGGRLRVDYNLGELGPLELSVFASYTWMRTWGEPGVHGVHDPHGGFELQWQEGSGRWNLTSGLRFERDVEEGDKYRQDVHLAGDVEQVLLPRHSLSLNYALRLRQKQGFDGVDGWTEMDLALGYKWSPHLSAVLTLEYSDDPAVLREGKLFVGGALRYFVRPDTYVQLRAGQNRPGLKCLNGVCRQFPAFSGAQLLAVARL